MANWLKIPSPELLFAPRGVVPKKARYRTQHFSLIWFKELFEPSQKCLKVDPNSADRFDNTKKLLRFQCLSGRTNKIFISSSAKKVVKLFDKKNKIKFLIKKIIYGIAWISIFLGCIRTPWPWVVESWRAELRLRGFPMNGLGTGLFSLTKRARLECGLRLLFLSCLAITYECLGSLQTATT